MKPKCDSIECTSSSTADTPSAATVFIVEDDASMLRSLTRTLKGAGHAVEAYTHPREFLAQAKLARPGCLVLDLCLPEINGIELQKTLGESTLPLPIVFISAHGDIPTAVHAMKAGAVDFLPKPLRTNMLLDAVAHALARDRGGWQAEWARRQARDRYALLSSQEKQVCRLVAQGLLNKQIAFELSLAEQTVRVYRGRVMDKLGVDSVAELVRLWVHLGHDS